VTRRYKIYNNKRNSTTQTHAVHLLIFLMYPFLTLSYFFLLVVGLWLPYS